MALNAAAFSSFHSSGGICSHHVQSNFLESPGAMFLASSAASIAMVPYPQNGSIRNLPGLKNDRLTIAAAMVSFIGAGTSFTR